MNIIAPGKLILSGEHATVHGCPVLAMAINRYMTVIMQPQDSAFISLQLSDLGYQGDLSRSALHAIKKRIRNDYQRFLAGQLSISKVLQSPIELTQFAMSLLLNRKQILSDGIKIHLHSGIPMGCGMGSSAATIIGTLYALAQHLGLSISSEQLLQFGLEAENVQHGTSSGIDLYMSLHGGCVFRDHQISASAVPTFPLYLINTGAPQSTTGECCMVTKKYFATGTIKDEFAAIARAMHAALQAAPQNKNDFLQAVRANHQLLTHMGVVPLRVQHFIREVENLQGAAKISGGGAIAGDAAGAVIAVVEDEAALRAICQHYQYSLSAVQGDDRGVHVI